MRFVLVGRIDPAKMSEVKDLMIEAYGARFPDVLDQGTSSQVFEVEMEIPEKVQRELNVVPQATFFGPCTPPPTNPRPDME